MNPGGRDTDLPAKRQTGGASQLRHLSFGRKIMSPLRGLGCWGRPFPATNISPLRGFGDSIAFHLQIWHPFGVPYSSRFTLHFSPTTPHQTTFHSPSSCIQAIIPPWPSAYSPFSLCKVPGGDHPSLPIWHPFGVLYSSLFTLHFSPTTPHPSSFHSSSPCFQAIIPPWPSAYSPFSPCKVTARKQQLFPGPALRRSR